MITVTLEGSNATAVSDEPITSGTIGLEVNYEFDESWDGLYKVALFKIGKDFQTCYLGQDTTKVYYPWEILTECHVGQAVQVGVCGYDDSACHSVVKPSVFATADYLEKGACNDDDRIPPSLIGELIKIAEEARKIAQETQANLEKAIPKGGYENQVLSKASDLDFDNRWRTVQGGGGSGGDLPMITPEDEGKFLKVVGQQATWEALQAYQGEYNITPQAYSQQTLDTREKIMQDDLVVKEIPYYETGNEANGNTVYIG